MKIYTDGSCLDNYSNRGYGGYAAIIEEDGKEKGKICGSYKNTTNNRMELLAVIEALKEIKGEEQNIEIYTDSAYIADCFNDGWYKSWRNYGWITSTGSDVKNKDLWMELIKLVEKHQAKFYKVKGHIIGAGQAIEYDYYKHFVKVNKKVITFQEFQHILKRNDECDKLANQEALEEKNHSCENCNFYGDDAMITENLEFACACTDCKYFEGGKNDLE